MCPIPLTLPWNLFWNHEKERLGFSEYKWPCLVLAGGPEGKSDWAYLVVLTKGVERQRLQCGDSSEIIKGERPVSRLWSLPLPPPWTRFLDMNFRITSWCSFPYPQFFKDGQVCNIPAECQIYKWVEGRSYFNCQAKEIWRCNLLSGQFWGWLFLTSLILLVFMLF